MKQISMTSTLKSTLLLLITAGIGINAQAGLNIESKAKIGWADDQLETVEVKRLMEQDTIRLLTNKDLPKYHTTTPSQYSNWQGMYSDPYQQLDTRSAAVMVYDKVSGRAIYEKNAYSARPIASITKLLTAMVVLDAKQPMSEEIYLEREDFRGPKKASSRLRAGDKLNRAQLMLIMLMKSENPAAKSLARHYPGGFDGFMRAMNAKAQEIGMTSAFFGDPTGLDKRNVASPADLVKLVKAASEYNLIRSFTTTKNYDFSLASRLVSANNTNYLVRKGMFDLGISKTGYIRESGKCVVMETQVNNRPAIVVILGAKNSAARWSDAEQILTFLQNRHTT